LVDLNFYFYFAGDMTGMTTVVTYTDPVPMATITPNNTPCSPGNTPRSDRNDTVSTDGGLSTPDPAILSASRLRLLQDTTMIESALDLDSLEEASSVGNSSQAGLIRLSTV
jgi:palmitoyltransferase ZDHHC9/14/18